MSPTLLELAVAIVIIVMAWQLGLALAPSIMRWIRSLKRDVDEAAEEALADPNQMPQTTLSPQHKEEHTNGTRQ